MKIWKIPLEFGCFSFELFCLITWHLVLVSGVRAEPVPASDVKADSMQTPIEVENLFSLEYPKLALESTKNVFSNPGCWEEREWTQFSLAVAVTVGVGALDKPIRNLFVRTNSDTRHDVARTVSRFGAEYLIGVIGAFEIAGLALDDRQALEAAHDAILSIAISNGFFTTPLKFITGRRRPSKHGDDYVFHPFSGNMSFPSGHTTQAFAAASAISEHYDSIWVSSVSYGLASMVGISMVALDSHYSSDVVAGGIIGAVIGKAVTNFNSEQRVQFGLMANRGYAELKLSTVF